MALNKQVFKTRALTAVLFVIVMLAGLLINSWTFLALFTLIHFGCWYEFQKLMGHIDVSYAKVANWRKWSGALIGWGFMLWNTKGLFIKNLSLQKLAPWVAAAGCVWVIAALLTETKSRKLILQYTLLALLYISLSWGLMMNISQWNVDGMPVIVLILIVSIWLNDTMAYIVGSMIGKTPFSKISPKKTWEGTIGGAILAVLIVTLLCRYIIPDWIGVSYLQKMALAKFYTQLGLSISLVGAVIGTLGDLLESKLKRMAGVKDSGMIMPGHGGFLDRFDSMLLATPFVWLILYLVS